MPYEIRKENPFEVERICLSGYTHEDMLPLINKYIKDGVQLIANVYFDTNLWDWDSSRNTCLALNGRDKIVVSRGDKGGELIRSTLSLTDRSWIFEGSECRSSTLKDNSYLKDKTFCDKSALTRTSLSGCRCINSILTDVVATNCEFINCNIQGDTLYDKRWKGMVIKSKVKEISKDEEDRLIEELYPPIINIFGHQKHCDALIMLGNIKEDEFKLPYFRDARAQDEREFVINCRARVERFNYKHKKVEFSKEYNEYLY